MRRAATALLLATLGCASSPPLALRERVGGGARVRAFASPTAYEAYLRAEVAAAGGDHAQALRQLELAAVADPTDGYLSARRVEVLLDAGDVEGARASALELTQSHPELSAAWLCLAEALTRAGDAVGAMDAARHAVALDPDDPDVRAATVGIAGGDAAAAAAARGAAPEARDGDRTLAARAMALDPAGIFRRSVAARRRALATEQAERGAWAQVDAALTPVVTLDARRVADRIRVVEARALDGRPADAAALVAGLRLGDDAASVRPAERARLWLLAGRSDLAAEEARAVLRTAPNDLLARRVLGHALLRLGDVPGAVEALGPVTTDAPAGPLLDLRRDALSGTFDAHGHVPGEGIAAPGVAWALARIAVAETLAHGGQPGLADRILAAAIEALTARDARGARDRLRVARARALVVRGAVADGRAALAEAETIWGRHRRAALAAFTEAPDAVLGDLRARSGDPHEDALADAWVVLVCNTRQATCASQDGAATLARATRDAPVAPATLRARAVRSDDRREAGALVRRAATIDPASPWTATLLRTLGGT
jgi:tetratricopeptide (TPR) repeat protein